MSAQSALDNTTSNNADCISKEARKCWHPDPVQDTPENTTSFNPGLDSTVVQAQKADPAHLRGPDTVVDIKYYQEEYRRSDMESCLTIVCYPRNVGKL